MLNRHFRARGEYKDQLNAILSRAVYIDAEAVGDYWLKTARETQTFANILEFPRALPPFEMSCVVMSPKGVEQEYLNFLAKRMQLSKHETYRVALLYVRRKVDSIEEYREAMSDDPAMAKFWTNPSKVASTKWLLSVSACLVNSKGVTSAYLFNALLPLTEDGRYIDCEDEGETCAIFSGELIPSTASSSRADIEVYNAFAWQYLCGGAFCLSLMNCKNSSLVPTKRGKPIPKEKTATKPPLFYREYTLTVRPLRTGGGESTGKGKKRPLHMVRGHFADYTKGAGLFGKWKGIYWVDEHWSGNGEIGIINKDYSISEGLVSN